MLCKVKSDDDVKKMLQKNVLRHKFSLGVKSCRLILNLIMMSIKCAPSVILNR